MIQRKLQGLLLALLLASGLVALLPEAAGAAPCEYLVQRGDTLSLIANRNGTSVRAILQSNRSITNPNVIRVGQRLLLPNCAAGATGVPLPTPPQTSVIVPSRPARPVPAAPADLLPALWQRTHDATINLRHPIEAPRYSGSGIVVGADGRTFITAYHVIGDPLLGTETSVVSIGPFGDWRFTAEVIARDASLDIAILRVREPDFPGFAVAPLGTASALKEGDAIYTLSYPGSGTSLVAGKGSLLGLARTFHNRSPLLMTNASATFGSSGGVAVNAQGEVIGIITGGILDRAGLADLGYPDLTQATLIVPIDSARSLLTGAGIP